MGARVVYLHGFASGPGSKKAQLFRERFLRRGIELEIPDLNEGGFERLTISGQLGVIERATRGEPVRLMGSSLGGYLAALYAARHPEVERLLLMAPAFGFANRFLGLRAEQVEDWKRTGWLRVFNYAAGRDCRLWWRFMEDAREYEDFPQTTQPVLIFHGVHDDTVPCSVSEEFVRRNADARLELVESDHELLSAVDQIWSSAEVFLGLTA